MKITIDVSLCDRSSGQTMLFPAGLDEKQAAELIARQMAGLEINDDYRIDSVYLIAVEPNNNPVPRRTANAVPSADLPNVNGVPTRS